MRHFLCPSTVGEIHSSMFQWSCGWFSTYFSTSTLYPSLNPLISVGCRGAPCPLASGWLAQRGARDWRAGRSWGCVPPAPPCWMPWRGCFSDPKSTSRQPSPYNPSLQSSQTCSLLWPFQPTKGCFTVFLWVPLNYSLHFIKIALINSLQSFHWKSPSVSCLDPDWHRQ